MRGVRLTFAALLLHGWLPPHAAAAVIFRPTESWPLAGPGVGERMVTFDLDDDCTLDLVVTRDFTTAAEDPSLNIAPGDTLGGFPAARGLDGGEQVADVAIADFNADGLPDLAAAENFDPQAIPVGLCQSPTPSVVVLLGIGAGQFSPGACLKAADHPNALAAADFDEDGTQDLLVANTPSSGAGTPSTNLYLFRGAGDGTFAAGQVVIHQRADDLETADLDGDGHLDLVVAGRASTYVFRGAGDGTFVPLGGGITGSARRVAVGDLNRDGPPDLAAVGSTPQSPADDVLWVALNDGTGRFGVPVSIPAGAHPIDVEVVDLDLDRYHDVVVANHLGDDAWVFMAGPGGVLSAPQILAAGRRPTALVVGDWDRNGFPDLAVADRNVLPGGSLGDGSVSVLLQDSPAPVAVGTTALPYGSVGLPYRTCLGARGGQPPYTWQVIGGSLPAALVLDGTSGGVSGTPANAGTTRLTLEVTDAIPASAVRDLPLIVTSLPTFTYHRDTDLDGFGDPAAPIESVDPAPPAGYVPNAWDCNDANATVRPGLPDGDCDGIDDNCDGRIDEAAPLFVYYRDGDGDGFGSQAVPLTTCATPPPAGYVAASGDCDDALGTVWSLPGEALGLAWLGDRSTLTWSPPADPGCAPATLLHDALRSTVPADFITGATCVVSDGTDTRAVDMTAPPPGEVFYYLVRPENPCGTGPLGAGSDGSPQTGAPCP